MKKRLIVWSVLFVLTAFLPEEACGQQVAVKTNLLQGGLTQTPNLGLECSLGKHSTLELAAGYNPWNLAGERNDNRKLVHWLASAEYRRFFCGKFGGHFAGLHLLGGKYNIGGHNLPWLLGKGSGDYRYEGHTLGGGLTYGYQYVLSRRWNLEASVGVGYMRLQHEKYVSRKNGESLGKEQRNYLGPTRLGISIIYVIK